MKATCKSVILALFLLLTGCAVNLNYTWVEYPITPRQLPLQNSIKAGKEIRILKEGASYEQEFIGKANSTNYYGSWQSLTDGVADQLAKELGIMGVKINNTAEKSLTIKLLSRQSQQGVLWNFAAKLEGIVTLGNGKSKVYKVRSIRQPTLPEAYNKAVALVVIEIINDQEVLTYINE